MAEARKAGALEPLINVPGTTKSFSSDTVERKWWIVDAKGQSIGRLATQITNVLRGKHKPQWTRHDDVGDFVVVINAKELQFRGNDKIHKKLYRRHTGYFGHLKTLTAAEMMEKSPEHTLWLAVNGMINRGALNSRVIKKLKIYSGAEHPHKAQKPEPLPLKT